MTKYYLWLLQLLRPANPDIHRIIGHYGDAKTAYMEISEGDTSALSEEESFRLRGISLEKAAEIEDICEKNGVKIVTLADGEYPALLKEIYNPPAVLFYRGNLGCLENLSITAVGSRAATPYIVKLCSRVCTDLAENGVTLISGMAHGVDSVVHNACVRLEKPTVGVLACGIDYDYPKGSHELREKIIMCGGAYLTELFPSVSPTADYFRMRNRILAGLSKGTAVFQAGAESGALITAGYALDENRDVFCVPPPDIFDPRYCGVVGFLRDGAVPIFNHEDILNMYTT